MAPSQPYRHLDPTSLAKLAGLKLRVEAVVEGTLSGLHRSPHHGSSIEFAEHKEYAPGDDTRHLDWKAYGKFDRYYIKRFEDETDLTAYLLLDCSGSMGYGAPLSKLEYGSVLLASLAYLLIRQGDKPGLLTFAERVLRYVPPRPHKAHLAEVLASLESLRPAGRTNVARAVTHLSEVLGHRTLVVLCSDLFDPREDALRLLRHLRARRHTVVLFHLLHPDELELPFSDLTLFESMEDETEMLVDPGGVRQAYLGEMGRFLRRVEQSCVKGEIEYHRLTTAEPPHQALLRFLGSGRSRE